MVSFKFILRHKFSLGKNNDSSHISNKTQEIEAQPGFICQTDEEWLKGVFTYVFYRFAHHYWTMVKNALRGNEGKWKIDYIYIQGLVSLISHQTTLSDLWVYIIFGVHIWWLF